MSATLQKKTPGVVTSASPTRRLDAESVTTIATSFLKRIGHKSGIKPKRVSLEEGVYVIEVEMKKLVAAVHIDAATHVIREYEIQQKAEESSLFSFSPKIAAIMLGVAVAVYVALHFAFQVFGL